MLKRNSDKLQSAIQSLKEALKYCQSEEFLGLGIEFKSVLMSAVAQNFHLTFIVCSQMLTRQLTDRLGAGDVDNKTLEEIVHMAANERLLTPLDRWLEYLACDQSLSMSNGALKTFVKAPAFLEDARELLWTCASRTQNERRKAA